MSSTLKGCAITALSNELLDLVSGCHPIVITLTEFKQIVLELEPTAASYSLRNNSRPKLHPPPPELASLRLTCKILNIIATPILFRTFWLSFDFGIQSNNSMKSFSMLAQSRLSKHVEALVIAPKHAVHRLDFQRLRYNLVQLACVLPINIAKLENLRSFQASACCPTAKSHQSLMLPEDLRTILTDTVGRTLAFLALQAPPSLSALELNLPLAYDFVQISKLQMTATSMTSVRGLDLQILDDSGTGGSLDHYESRSSIQALHPNSLYADGVVELLRFLPNLHSLNIAATHVLNMEGLKDANLCHLRALSLRRIRISAIGVHEIIRSGCWEQLKCLKLEECSLTSGKWQDVFSSIQGLRNLVDLTVSAVDYWQDWASLPTQQAVSLSFGLDNGQKYLTVDDKQAVQSLERAVQERRTRQDTSLYRLQIGFFNGPSDHGEFR